MRNDKVRYFEFYELNANVGLIPVPSERSILWLQHGNTVSRLSGPNTERGLKTGGGGGGGAQNEEARDAFGQLQHHKVTLFSQKLFQKYQSNIVLNLLACSKEIMHLITQFGKG